MNDRFKFNAVVSSYYDIDTPEEYKEVEPRFYLKNVDVFCTGEIGVDYDTLLDAVKEQSKDLTEKEIGQIMQNFEDNSNSPDCEFVSITPDKIIQSTGLKDKNGKLIYEGDIVRLFCDEFENIHIVKFGDFDMYSLDFQTEYEKGSTAVYGYYLGGLKYPIPLSISLDTSGMQIEVIGNIYENKELLNDR